MSEREQIAIAIFNWMADAFAEGDEPRNWVELCSMADAGDEAASGARRESFEIADALLSGPISELAARAEAAENEVRRLREFQRWNVEEDGSDLLVCRGDHHRSEKCDFERYVPFRRASPPTPNE